MFVIVSCSRSLSAKKAPGFRVALLPASQALLSQPCAAGSAPAIGHTPSGTHQQIIGSMSIPLFPGMPMGAMHMGPEGPAPNMTGPAAAPAANGPAGANPGGRAPGSGAAPPAGAGQGAGRGQGMGLNQALNHVLQSAMVQAGGQAARPGAGATAFPYCSCLPLTEDPIQVSLVHHTLFRPNSCCM